MTTAIDAVAGLSSFTIGEKNATALLWCAVEEVGSSEAE